MDLMYFGYEWDKESYGFQKEFIAAITEKFPSVKLVDAYDSIKGYRQEVHLDDELKDDYIAWVIAHEWLDFSLTLQLLIMDSRMHDELDKMVTMAKEQYPQNFKAV